MERDARTWFCGRKLQRRDGRPPFHDLGACDAPKHEPVKLHSALGLPIGCRPKIANHHFVAFGDRVEYFHTQVGETFVHGHHGSVDIPDGNLAAWPVVIEKVVGHISVDDRYIAAIDAIIEMTNHKRFVLLFGIRHETRFARRYFHPLPVAQLFEQHDIRRSAP